MHFLEHTRESKVSRILTPILTEIIEEEILPKTTVKSALRLRCVSKSWCSLIDSDPFIEKHFRNSKRRRTGSVFNHCPKCGPCFSPCYLGDTQPSVDPPPFDDEFIVARCYVVGHHNGLLCILKLQEDQQQYFFLWNPATRTSVQLPYPGLLVHKFKLGFGWDEQSGTYKVFLGVPDHPFYHEDGDYEGDYDGRIARIYSSETNAWRAVKHGSESNFGKFGVFAHGKIYWLTRSGHIDYLDLRNEVFGKTMISPPSSIRFGNEDIRVWLWEEGGSLCIVCDTNNCTKRSVWVMKKENNWVEHGGVASELSMEVHGVFGAFTYVETLISPPPLLLEEE